MDNVNHPKHYEQGFATRPLECIDVTRYLPFSLGNAVKYVWRAGKKGDTAKALEDLEKALWYIDSWDMEVHFGRMHDCIGVARSVFDLVVNDKSNRYLAIRSLLNGATGLARDYIQLMKGEFENENR